jgi:hypothetical protein
MVLKEGVCAFEKEAKVIEALVKPNKDNNLLAAPTPDSGRDKGLALLVDGPDQEP